MMQKKMVYLVVLVFISTSLACSITGAGKQVQSAEQTALAVRTQVSGVISAGSSLLKTAQALATSRPGILETARAIATQGAPVIGTLQAVATHDPSLVKTAQAIFEQEVPTGEPPSDIPVLNQDQVSNFIGSSQYIFYTSPTGYSQVLAFYQSAMPENGWEYQASDSHEYANAAQLTYIKDSRTATVNLSLNPLNQTSVVVINIVNR